MEAIIYNPYPVQEHYSDKKPKAWEVKVYTFHINRDFKRNELLKISAGKKSIYRYVKGVSYNGLNQNKVWIDYDSRIELGVEFNSIVKVEKASIIESYIIAPLKNPNPWERQEFYLTTLIAILSIVLTILQFLD